MDKNTRELTYAQAINEAIRTAMSADERVICYGLGVPDPKGVFGTTVGLAEQFGTKRVFDVPTSENAFTGVGIGASMTGLLPIMTHQRLDFFLLAIDQLVNAAAKWHFMFGSQVSIPITIRLIIGRGWGQGPTHSQSLQSWFAHIPGLKVVMPSNARDAKGMMLSAIFDPNPVVFLEHRWLHNSKSLIPEDDYRVEIGSSELLRSGNDITIVSSSIMTVEALRASKYLSDCHGIDVDLIDARSIKPFDWSTLFKSVSKTGRLLALDSGFSNCSFSSEICSRVASEMFNDLKSAPKKLGMPDQSEPTSFALTKGFHPGAKDIVEEVLTIFQIDDTNIEKSFISPLKHDVPGEWFSGPF